VLAGWVSHGRIDSGSSARTTPRGHLSIPTHEFHPDREDALSRPPPPRSFRSREPKYRRNGKIRAREVRVLDEDKNQVGVMTLTDALRLAQNQGLDLVEISPNALPPVCRIVNYGKLMYEEAKATKDSRGPGDRMKELQLSAGIDPHDFSVKLNHAIRFLCDDMKVRIKLRFRGRQRAHKEVGFEVVNRFVKEAAAYGHADAPPKLLGERDLNVILSPLPKNKRGVDPRAGDPPRSQAHAAGSGHRLADASRSRPGITRCRGSGDPSGFAPAQAGGLLVGPDRSPGGGWGAALRRRRAARIVACRLGRSRSVRTPDSGFFSVRFGADGAAPPIHGPSSMGPHPWTLIPWSLPSWGAALGRRPPSDPTTPG
jgi:translation initiation factor IF-3